jgi:uncharacterized protein (DUF1684 family)
MSATEPPQGPNPAPAGGSAAANPQARGEHISTSADRVALAEWRRTIAELYADVRALAAEDPHRAATRFRTARDWLFRQHPESPIPVERRSGWQGASWYPYDPAWRITGIVRSVARRNTLELALAADGITRCTHVATIEFAVHGQLATLPLYWFEGYGGGLWLPFADSTNGASTYGGGRYLYDTIKGADLGATSSDFILDFNFAYNPSCAYEDRWSCPLPPSENRLPFAILAGERMPGGERLR